ncbi:TPA: hypothetical protein ACH3X3_005179 [Trebouxia sp. C0006]
MATNEGCKYVYNLVQVHIPQPRDTPAKCFSSLLHGMGQAMLARSSLQGKLGPRSGGLIQLMQPQTSGSRANLEDQTCHMPACGKFPKGSPFTKHETDTETNKTWYTWVSCMLNMVAAPLAVGATQK